jgi:twinkle protein
MKKFIEWQSIPLSKAKGSQKVKCPACIDDRTNKSDKSLSVNIDLGVAKCHYCEAVSVREKRTVQTKTYELPKQDWQNFTSLSDKLVKWIGDERKIKQSTLMDFGITEESFYQPKHGKDVNNIVFNYFEGDQVVNKKYRSGDKGFTQSKGGKPILYNINSAIGADEVWIVEGEFDVLALHEVGIKTVLSLPSGANDNDDYWINSEPYLKGVKKFIIAVDTDDKGIAIREKIAQRLGRYRCEFVEWIGKDANDDLVSGSLFSSVKNRQRFPVGGTFSVDDLINDIYDLYDNGLPKTLALRNPCFGNLNSEWTTMRGHLVTTTGIPSHGKSSFVEWIALNYVNDYDMKLSFFSPEHSPMALHQSRLIEKVTGKKFFGTNRLNKSEIERYKVWAHERVYLTAPENGEFPTWSWLFDKFKEQMFAYGVDIFIIDAFNKLEFDKGGDDLRNIRKVLTQLTMFAQMNNVLILLVAHPTKMRKKENGQYEVPTLYDVSGSADFRNQTHDGFTIHRYFGNEVENPYTCFINTKTKFQFQGNIGATVNFQYDVDNGRYYAQGSHPDKSDWTADKGEKQVALSSNFDFDLENEESDDLPF